MKRCQKWESIWGVRDFFVPKAQSNRNRLIFAPRHSRQKCIDDSWVLVPRGKSDSKEILGPSILDFHFLPDSQLKPTIERRCLCWCYQNRENYFDFLHYLASSCPLVDRFRFGLHCCGGVAKLKRFLANLTYWVRYLIIKLDCVHFLSALHTKDPHLPWTGKSRCADFPCTPQRGKLSFHVSTKRDCLSGKAPTCPTNLYMSSFRC